MWAIGCPEDEVEDRRGGEGDQERCPDGEIARLEGELPRDDVGDVGCRRDEEEA